MAQDVPELPAELRDDVLRYQQILALDPVDARGVPNHALKGQLKHCRALEIEWNRVAYRLMYRIYESPAPRQVEILSSLNTIQPTISRSPASVHKTADQRGTHNKSITP